MFISEKLIFLELHKTGCSHILSLLKLIQKGIIVGKHNQVSNALLKEEKLLVGSIRNPWDWYVSLWAYGCNGKGAFHKRLTDSSKVLDGIFEGEEERYSVKEVERITNIFNRLYKDIRDTGAFREWLSLIHNNECFNVIGEGYDVSSSSEFAGLLTHRYMRLFCIVSEIGLNFPQLNTLEQLIEWEREKCFIDYFITTENLLSDFIKLLDILDISIDCALKTEIKVLAPINKSTGRLSTNSYYDNSTVEFIYEREQFIVRKFNYRFNC